MAKVNVKIDGEAKEIYIDGILKDNLDTIKTYPKKNMDAVLVVDGRVGFGKSTLATTTLAAYLDSTKEGFSLDKIAWTPTEYRDLVRTLPEGSALVFDEVFGWLNTRASLSKTNRMLNQILSEQRLKKLFVIMCLPSIFDLDKFVAMHRSTCLLYCYKRGRFAFFDYRKKKTLIIMGKKYYSYHTPAANFTGCFTINPVLDWNEYEERKQRSLFGSSQDRGIDSKYLHQRNTLIKYIYDKKHLNQSELGKMLGLTKSAIGLILRDSKDKASCA